jgi:hypothetical protein
LSGTSSKDAPLFLQLVLTLLLFADVWGSYSHRRITV